MDVIVCFSFTEANVGIPFWIQRQTHNILFDYWATFIHHTVPDTEEETNGENEWKSRSDVRAFHAQSIWKTIVAVVVVILLSHLKNLNESKVESIEELNIEFILLILFYARIQIHLTACGRKVFRLFNFHNPLTHTANGRRSTRIEWRLNAVERSKSKYSQTQQRRK